MISKALERLDKRCKTPMEVTLTFKMNFGDTPADSVTLIDERKVPLVGSVFDNRDRIAREFVRLMLKAGAQQQRLMRHVLRRKRRETGE